MEAGHPVRFGKFIHLKFLDMKKNILILTVILAACSLSALAIFPANEKGKEAAAASEETKPIAEYPMGRIQDLIHPVYLGKGCNGPKEESDLVYKIDHRFYATTTKSQLLKAETIWDILPMNNRQYGEEYGLVSISPVTFDEETRNIEYNEPGFSIKGEDIRLTEQQKTFLASVEYSDNIYFRGDFGTSEAIGNHYMQYFVTVVPEQEAEFMMGDEALIRYLKNNIGPETTHLTKDKVKPAKVHFTINPQGILENVYLGYTSGFEEVDELLVKVVKQMPGAWLPARNADGEAVPQELVFYFGNEGC